MALTAAQKAQIVEKYQRKKKDTGSSEVQIALLTARISYLTEHLKNHKFDVHTRYGLTKLVSQRRKLLRYLKIKNADRYRTLVDQLEVRG